MGKRRGSAEIPTTLIAATTAIAAAHREVRP